jgi:hypothetical protein
MKWLIIIVVVLVIGYLIWPRRQVKVRGTISELSEYLRGLIASNNPHAFLIVNFSGSPHFIQFSVNKHGIQLNMPLITTDQILKKTPLENACREEGFCPRITKGSDGSEFVDCEIKGETEAVISVIEKITASVFSMNKGNRVKYILSGYCQRVASNL